MTMSQFPRLELLYASFLIPLFTHTLLLQNTPQFPIFPILIEINFFESNSCNYSAFQNPELTWHKIKGIWGRHSTLLVRVKLNNILTQELIHSEKVFMKRIFNCLAGKALCSTDEFITENNAFMMKDSYRLQKS